MKVQILLIMQIIKILKLNLTLKKSLIRVSLKIRIIKIRNIKKRLNLKNKDFIYILLLIKLMILTLNGN